MSQYDHLLEKLCQYPETLDKAKGLLREAIIKTAPGSGFNLGTSKPGLPAICAYIASQRLQNSDVSRPAAQEASCLKKSDFEKTYYLVDNALCGDRRTRRKTADVHSGKQSYEQMVNRYNLPIGPLRMVPCLVKAEKAILANPHYSPSIDESHLKLVNFWYVCKTIKGTEMFPMRDFCQENRIPYKSFEEILSLVRKAVFNLKDEIRDYIRSTRPQKVVEAQEKLKKNHEPSPDEEPLARPSSPSKAGSPTKATGSPLKESIRAAPVASPSKAPLRELPSRSPQKRDLPQDEEAPVSHNADSLPLPSGSPSKRRRTELSTLGAAPPTPPDSASGTPINVRSSGPFSPEPTGPPGSESLRDLDDPRPSGPRNHHHPHTNHTTSTVSSKNLPFPPLPHRQRRYRPIYTDQAQWCSCDTKLRKLRQTAEEHKEEMTKLYGHPLQKAAVAATTAET